RLNALTLVEMAIAPPPPKNVRVETKELENNTTLVWNPGDTPNTEFEVVWRDTDAGEWQHSAFAGKVTRITLPESKDNVFFGVRAVSANGFKSYAATPVPER
ncbi:MAG TPA: M28 family metallopeptidase, partial [Terriglobales bacterium]